MSSEDRRGDAPKRTRKDRRGVGMLLAKKVRTSFLDGPCKGKKVEIFRRPKAAPKFSLVFSGVYFWGVAAKKGPILWGSFFWWSIFFFCFSSTIRELRKFGVRFAPLRSRVGRSQRAIKILPATKSAGSFFGPEASQTVPELEILQTRPFWGKLLLRLREKEKRRRRDRRR